MVYWIIDTLCLTAGIAGFVLAFTEKKTKYCWAGPVWIIVYPILLEVISNLIARCR
jgi:predicted Co/Zn/Cd cation transporter (cation efflux family)